LAPCNEQESDEVDVPPVPVGGTEAAGDGEAVAELLEREVEETVEPPTARVVVSVDVVDTPLMSVDVSVSPSVTLVSGTPASGVGVGDGVWAADCVGKAIAKMTNTNRHNRAFPTFLVLTLSIFFLRYYS
jgi:hypothetical protein